MKDTKAFSAVVLMVVLLASLFSIRLFAQEPAVNQPTELTEEQADSIASLYDELDELVITAKKEAVTYDGAKLTYDMEQDNSTKGSTMLDVLRKVPMVSVDGDDNIYIKGSKNFKIYVNGREEPMLTANASTVLKAMPADAAAKIEVITEPGAKYDAEGVGGILNIVTERKQSKNGYTGSLTGNMSNRNAGGSGYLRFKQDKVTADFSVNGSSSIFGGHQSVQSATSISKVSDTDWKQLAEMTQQVQFGYIDGKFNLSYEATDRDLFTVGAGITSFNGGVDKLDSKVSMYSRAGDLQWSYRQLVDNGNMTNLSANGQASYKHTFDDAGQSLAAAYSFNFGKSGLDLDYKNSWTEGYIGVMLPYQHNKNMNYTRQHTATLDYTNPFKSAKHILDIGAKGIFRLNGADSRQSVGMTADMLDPLQISLTRQIQNVYAGYATYTGKYGAVSLTAGLRYEHTYMGLDFLRGSDIPDFRRHLNDWVPNAALSYSFGPVSNLRLAYQMRISRPGIEQMNPFQFRMMEFFVTQGNPDLESEKYHNITLTFSKYDRKIGGSITLDLSQSNNTIESYHYWIGNVEYQTYGNIGRKSSAGLQGFITYNPTQNMNFNVSGNVNYNYLRSPAHKLTNHAWVGGYNVSWNYSMPHQFSTSVYGGQNTGDITLQGRWHGYYYYGLSLSKGFLAEKALTVTLNANNFLSKYMRYKSENFTETHNSWSRTRANNWNVGVTVSWKFGHLKDKVKQTGASLENTDISSKKQSGSGGIM
ncbi:MAG: TonB-dependent receptor [Muribaculaceae bacterium]|nr:TonB-dependent receptor [Muribaculaceae bacterium]